MYSHFDKLNLKRYSEIFRFGIVGIIATIIHYVLYVLLKNIFSYNLSYTIGYLIALFVNYYLSAKYTFKVKASFLNLLGMLFSHLINYIIHLFLLNLFITNGLSKNLAPIPVYIIAVPINFILVRFVFKYNSK